MARLQRKDLANPDEVREFPGGSRVEIFQLEDVVVGRTVWLPGWRWSEVVKPIAGTELCEYHHLGYSISGRFRVAMPDGTEMEIPPNHVYEIPAGHDAWVVGDEPWIAIDWAGMRSFARPMAGAASASWRLWSSPTSWARRPSRSASAMTPGASCWRSTTSGCGGSSTASAAAR